MNKSREPRRSDPVAETARTLVQLLESRADSNLFWITRIDALQQIPELTEEAAAAALKKSPAKQRIVVAVPNEDESPWILKEDLNRLASAPDFLSWLVSRKCSAETPVLPLTVLTQDLERNVRKLVEAHWKENCHQPLPGMTFRKSQVGRKAVLAIHDTRYSLPEVVLSEKLLSILRERRAACADAAPVWLSTLKEQFPETGDKELLYQATQVAPFVDFARLVPLENDSIVVLNEDLPTVMQSADVLRHLVQTYCQSATPDVKLSKLARFLPKELQESFFSGWIEQIAQGRELDFADCQPLSSGKKRDALFRDQRFPPPEKELAENLVRILTYQKSRGEQTYPMNLKSLMNLAGAPVSSVLRSKALNSEPFSQNVIRALHDDVDSPVALSGDELLLAQSPNLLTKIVARLRTTDNHAVGVEKITRYKSLHPDLRTHLEDSVIHSLTTRTLPAGIGAIQVGKKWCLIQLSDVIGIAGDLPTPLNPATSSEFPTGSISSAPDQFVLDFDAAFRTLEGKLGLPNYASLADLRPALPQYSREFFDRELLKLRHAGRYSLSLVEGRFGMTELERNACLIVDHVPHLLVQKKTAPSVNP